jgi:uncharacterized protein YutE (UPF0331/DUF86 family)/predicted nucleotidyltransferase
MNTLAMLDKLPSDLSCLEEVCLIYLFRSQEESGTGPMPGYDLGVLFASAAERPQVEAQLARELARVLRTDRIDIVLLDRAPIELAYAFVAQGKLLYERDVATRVEYEADVMGRYAHHLSVLPAQRDGIWGAEERSPTEFTGIERRLEILSERLARLRPLRDKARTEFDRDPYLRDIVERNLEVAARCCIDICHRIISLEGARKPSDCPSAILTMGELGILPHDLACYLATLADLGNVLIHEYDRLDWDEVYHTLHRLEDLERFAELVRHWLQQRATSGEGAAE